MMEANQLSSTNIVGNKRPKVWRNRHTRRVVSLFHGNRRWGLL